MLALIPLCACHGAGPRPGPFTHPTSLEADHAAADLLGMMFAASMESERERVALWWERARDDFGY